VSDPHETRRRLRLLRRLLQPGAWPRRRLRQGAGGPARSRFVL